MQMPLRMWYLGIQHPDRKAANTPGAPWRRVFDVLIGFWLSVDGFLTPVDCRKFQNATMVAGIHFGSFSFHILMSHWEENKDIQTGDFGEEKEGRLNPEEARVKQARCFLLVPYSGWIGPRVQASPSHCAPVSCICAHVLSVLFQPLAGPDRCFY